MLHLTLGDNSRQIIVHSILCLLYNGHWSYELGRCQWKWLPFISSSIHWSSFYNCLASDWLGQSSDTLWLAETEHHGIFRQLTISWHFWSNHSLSHGPIWALRYFEIVWIVIIRTREICEYQEWGRGTHLDNHFVSCDPRLVMQPNNLIGTRHSIMFWILLCSGKQRFN